jgi:hypothetical protein
MPAFITVKPIRMQHRDSAGVVFTPQYFNLFTEVLEDWWEQELGISSRDLIFTYQCAIPLRTFAGEFLVLEFHLVVDFTGVKVYGEGAWNTRWHGVSKRRTWRKLHVGVNEATGEIVSMLFSITPLCPTANLSKARVTPMRLNSGEADAM